MATYIEKHTVVTKDTLNVDHNSRETFQHVKFMNPENIYMGTFTSKGYKFEDLVNHNIYDVVLSGGYAVISGDNSEVAVVNADQIKDLLDERTVSSYGAIPSLPLISALNDAINKRIIHLDNSTAKLSGNNDISGYNRIEELDISSLSAAQTTISSLAVVDGLSANMLSVQSLNDIIADGETLSSVLSDIGADVEALEDEMHAADLSIVLKLNDAVDNLIDRENTISAQLSDEVIQLSANLSTDIDSLSAALSDEIQILSGQLSDEVEQLSSSLSDEVIQLSANLSTGIDTISAALSTDYVGKISDALSSANSYTDTVSAALSTTILNVSVAADATPAEGYLKTYTIAQGGIERGKINIPKDFLVKSGSVETVVTPGQPYPDAKEGDKYIDLVINSKDSEPQAEGEHLYIPANSLVDIYEGHSGICITTNVDGNIISADINLSSIAKDKLSSDVLSSLSLADSSLQLSDIVDISASTESVDAVANAYNVKKELTALSSYITAIKHFDNDPVSAQLSVVKLSAEDYYALVADDATISNALYVVEDTKIDAYGQQIKNVAAPTDLSDAATKEYIDGGLSRKQDTIADLEEIRLSAANALPLSDVVDVDAESTTGKAADAESAYSNLSALSSYITAVKYFDNDPVSAQLSVVKLSAQDYYDLVIDDAAVSNVVYVVEDNKIDAYGQEIKNVLSADSETNAATVGQVGAAKVELRAYADEISAQARRELSGKLDLSGGILTSVYDGNGKKFSDWVCVPATYDWNFITIVETPSEEAGMVNYTPYSNGVAIGRTGTTSEDILSLRWRKGAASLIDLTATRAANKFLGYQLGEQHDKKLASAEQGAKADTAIQDLLIAKTWSELKTLRDGGSLVPGQQYHITDYVATTNGDMESQSADHQFDIIVTADDEHTLNEHARAVIHDGDLPDDIVDGSTRTKYFAGCDLAAWNVWYCLDNDTDRFTWAVTDGGRGVVYRLVDEFQNDCPYDFKGIQFHPYGDVITAETVNDFPEIGQEGIIYYATSTNTAYRWNPDWDSDSDGEVDDGESKYVETSDTAWRYTFDSGDSSGNTDLSLHGGTSGAVANYVFSNKILPLFYEENGLLLNCIVFKGSYCHSNTFGSSCYSNTFGSSCSGNTFGSYCSSNTLGSDCSGNTFGSYCSSNTFGSYCSSNTFGSYCSSNTFGSYCHNNTFGSSCYNNTFGSYCYRNTFGSYCYRNTFGSYCSSNTFGNYCYSNTFGSYCYSGLWTVHSQFYAGTTVEYSGVLRSVLKRYRSWFSSSQTYLVGETLRHGSQYWECTAEHRGAWNANHFTEVQLVGGILSANEYVPLSCYRYVELEDGVSYVALDCTANRGNSVYYQNVTVSKGIAGTESSPKHIEDANHSQSFKTTYQPANSKVISI